MIHLKQGNVVFHGIPGAKKSIEIRVPELDFSEMMRADLPTSETLGFDPEQFDENKVWQQYANRAIKWGEIAMPSSVHITRNVEATEQAQLHAHVALSLQALDI